MSVWHSSILLMASVPLPLWLYCMMAEKENKLLTYSAFPFPFGSPRMFLPFRVSHSKAKLREFSTGDMLLSQLKVKLFLDCVILVTTGEQFSKWLLKVITPLGLLCLVIGLKSSASFPTLWKQNLNQHNASLYCTWHTYFFLCLDQVWGNF